MQFVLYTECVLYGMASLISLVHATTEISLCLDTRADADAHDTHTHTQTRARARAYTHTHTHTQHTHNDTMTEMHSLAVFLAKAGYGTVAEMEETLKDMVGVGVVWTWVWLLGVDVQSLGFRV